MTVNSLDFNKHCKVLFGKYIESQEDDNPTNAMPEQTLTGIYLGDAANFQGSYKILCLQTKKRIMRKQFKEIPVPQSVIKKVAAMGFH